MIIRRGNRKRQRGVAIVEVAIGFSVVAILIFFCIETAIIFQDKQTLTNMAREMARGLAAGDSVEGAQTRALKWNQANIPNASNSVTFTAEQSSDGTTWTSISDLSVSGQNTTNNATPGNLVRVTAAYNGTNFAHFFGANITGFQSAATMRME